MKSIFGHIHKLLALASSIRSKLRTKEKKHNKKPTIPTRNKTKSRTSRSAGQLRSLTIQNQPTWKMKGADYLGLALKKENRATKMDSYW
jgi:hypothetical protein